MKERKLLKKVYRTHKIAHNKKLEALMVLFDDCIYIRIDVLYINIQCRDTYCDMYISSYYKYLSFPEKLRNNGVSEKLVKKVEKVLDIWMEKEYFEFPNDELILINGGQNDDNQ